MKSRYEERKKQNKKNGKYISLLSGGRMQEDPSGPVGPGERALYRVRGDDWDSGAAQLRHQAGQIYNMFLYV